MRPRTLLPVLRSIQHTCATIRRIVAAAIHDARCTVDEPRIPVAHSTIDPSLQLVEVVVWGCVPVFSCHCRVGLHRVQPVEEACDPLQLCWRAILTDRIWVCAEVDLGEQSIPALGSGSLAQVIIQLTEVTDTSCLDDAAAPPTAPLKICASCWLPEEWRRRVRAPLAVAEVPATCLDPLVIPASACIRPCLVHISKVCVQIDVVWEMNGSRRVAPRLVVPPRRLRNHRLWRTEHFSGRPIPFCLCVRPKFHVGVHIAGHLAARHSNCSHHRRRIGSSLSCTAPRRPQC